MSLGMYKTSGAYKMLSNYGETDEALYAGRPAKGTEGNPSRIEVTVRILRRELGEGGRVGVA